MGPTSVALITILSESSLGASFLSGSPFVDSLLVVTAAEGVSFDFKVSDFEFSVLFVGRSFLDSDSSFLSFSVSFLVVFSSDVLFCSLNSSNRL